jgi:hypothetical protein
MEDACTWVLHRNSSYAIDDLVFMGWMSAVLWTNPVKAPQSNKRSCRLLKCGDGSVKA